MREGARYSKNDGIIRDYFNYISDYFAIDIVRTGENGEDSEYY